MGRDPNIIEVLYSINIKVPKNLNTIQRVVHVPHAQQYYVQCNIYQDKSGNVYKVVVDKMVHVWPVSSRGFRLPLLPPLEHLAMLYEDGGRSSLQRVLRGGRPSQQWGQEATLSPFSAEGQRLSEGGAFVCLCCCGQVHL